MGRCQHGLMGVLLPVVCLCGPSAAGKTTFSLAMAKALRQRGRQPLLITCDDYYRQGWRPDPRFGFDTVAAIDDDALRRDISAARAGQSQTLRHYDMCTRTVGRRPVTEPYDLVVVEGAYGPQCLLDFPLVALLYLDAPLPLRLWRRLKRDVSQRRRSPLYVVRQMVFQMLPGEQRFIHPLRDDATLVVRDAASDLAKVLSMIGS